MKRLFVQISSTLITNSYLKGIFMGKIYKGLSKSLCVPGLNCYSCPSAIGSCPIGSLQAVMGSIKYKFSYYVIGLLMLFASVFGRFICGWICPFGLVQDTIYKVPIKKKRLISALSYFKYVILIYFVLIFPIIFANRLGMATPAFCKYICPSGTLMGAIPLLIVNQGLRSAIGNLFIWKLTILIAILILSASIYRIFCRLLCPLGAIYSLFNKISIYRYEFNEELCNGCKACAKVCQMGVIPYKDVNDKECIRCGKCIEVCSKGAIRRLSFKKNVHIVEIDTNYIERNGDSFEK